MKPESADSRPAGSEPPRAEPARRLLLPYLTAGLLFAWIWQESFDRLAFEQIPYSRFQEAIAQGELREVAVGERWIEGSIAPNLAERPEGLQPALDGGHRAIHRGGDEVADEVAWQPTDHGGGAADRRPETSA